MADANFEVQRLAELLAEANEQLARNGKVRQQTQDEITDAEMKAKYGVENFTKGTAKAAEAVTALAGSAFSAGKAMYDGKKGAAAFNDSLDDMSKAATAAGIALSLLIPGGIVIKAVVAGLTAVAGAAIAYTKAANEMADKQYKAFSGLQKSGAAAADGMGGVFRDAKKLGLSMNELDSMVSLVAENSTDLAQFAGSVSDGRKRLADMGQSLEANRAGFLKMGLSMQDVNEGMAGYLRTVQRTGAAQKMTNDQLAASARNYIYEQDVLTKITGMSAKKQQEATERALQEEQFLAKIRQLELNGETQKANELKKLNIMYSAQGEQVGAGFRALVNGNQRNADAQMVFRSSYGKVQEGINDVIAGTSKASGAFKKGADGFKQYVDGPGQQLAQLGASEGSFVKFSQAVSMANAAGMDMAAAEAKAEADLIARGAKGGKAQDAATEAMGNTIAKQIEANKAMESFVNLGVAPATEAMGVLADATIKAGNILNKLAPGGEGKITKKDTAEGGEAVGAIGLGIAGGLKGAAMGAMLGPIGAAVGAVIGSAAGVYLGGAAGKKIGELGGSAAGLPEGADGGMFSGPTTGYLARLHGNELVIPENQLMGTVQTGGMSSAGGLGEGGYEKLKKYNEDILKDVEKMVKVTDSDTKRTERYSLTYKRILDLKEELFDQEIEDLEAQKELRKTMASAGGGLLSGMFGGAQGGANTRSIGGGASGMGGGTGVKPPAAKTTSGSSNMSSMEGGQGLKASSNDLLQFGGASGSASNFEGLNDRLKTAVMNAADEYKSLTGNKLKINSAKRDPEDQLRLYQETIDAGRPGIGPTGMPVGRPGTSSHEKGQAVDIQNYNDPAALSALNRQGLQQVVPKDPVHFQLSGETGMIAEGPTSGYQATLHGKEAVIPMQNNSGDFVKMFETMAASNYKMVEMLDELVRVQRNSNDIQTKMLRTAQN
jgi:hypothetical protein